MRSLVTQVSGAVAVAVLGAVVESKMGTNPSPEHAQQAYNSAFLFAAIGVGIGLVVASRLPRGTLVHEGVSSEALLAAE